MQREGPPLEVLSRRLIETPPEFLAEPVIGRKGDVDVGAVVWDTLRQIGIPPLQPDDLSGFRPAGRGNAKDRNRLQLTLLSCWLLHEPWFHDNTHDAEAVRQFLESTLAILAESIPSDRIVADPDRREELIRQLLSDFGLRPAGETANQASDRLQTLNSAERLRVLREAARAEKRAQEIREAMARKAAQESASRYGE